MAVIECGSCGSTIDDSWAECPACGAVTAVVEVAGDPAVETLAPEAPVPPPGPKESRADAGEDPEAGLVPLTPAPDLAGPPTEGAGSGALNEPAAGDGTHAATDKPIPLPGCIIVIALLVAYVGALVLFAVRGDWGVFWVLITPAVLALLVLRFFL